METHVSANPDLSLAFKRGLFGSLLWLGERQVVQAFSARFLEPDNPRLACMLGEGLAGTPRRVMALTAHQDDLEFFAGGTLRRMARAGCKIHAVVLTDGEKRGNWTDLADQRREEQREAARLQGFASVTFLGLPDFGLPEDPRVEPLVARCWDQIWPEVVLAFDPKELLPHVANRDHKALGRTVMDLTRARLHTGAQVYFYGTHYPNTLVDITTVMDEKVRAAQAHRSQMVYLDDQEVESAFRAIAKVSAGRSGCTYAEGFYRLV